MSRSPLSYPLNRSADMDAGGAADLQTDIMRFMAILSLCLVAIFALVQSIPISPTKPSEENPPTPPPAALAVTSNVSESEPVQPAAPIPSTPRVEKTITLTRPKWVPKYVPDNAAEQRMKAASDAPLTAPALPDAKAPSAPPVESETAGFTLRFESDAALTRLVASSRVGLYAIEPDRAKRMTVSNSRISFWDASTPNTFHEMEADTVPASVIEALNRTGIAATDVSWGVTLPGKLRSQLDNLMQEHRSGSLIIAASGEILWEAS